MISLRPTQPEDLDFILRCNQNSSPQFLLQWAGRIYTYPLTKEQLLYRLTHKPGTCFFTILQDQQMAGSLELTDIHPEERSGTVTCVLLGEAFRGQKIGQQAIALLKDYALNQLELTSLSLTVVRDNLAAIRCYEKEGFAVLSEGFAGPEQTPIYRMGCQLTQ